MNDLGSQTSPIGRTEPFTTNCLFALTLCSLHSRGRKDHWCLQMPLCTGHSPAISKNDSLEVQKLLFSPQLRRSYLCPLVLRPSLGINHLSRKRAIHLGVGMPPKLTNHDRASNHIIRTFELPFQAIHCFEILVNAQIHWPVLVAQRTWLLINCIGFTRHWNTICAQ